MKAIYIKIQILKIARKFGKSKTQDLVEAYPPLTQKLSQKRTNTYGSLLFIHMLDYLLPARRRIACGARGQEVSDKLTKKIKEMREGETAANAQIQKGPA